MRFRIIFDHHRRPPTYRILCREGAGECLYWAGIINALPPPPTHKFIKGLIYGGMYLLQDNNASLAEAAAAASRISGIRSRRNRSREEGERNQRSNEWNTLAEIPIECTKLWRTFYKHFSNNNITLCIVRTDEYVYVRIFRNVYARHIIPHILPLLLSASSLS